MNLDRFFDIHIYGYVNVLAFCDKTTEEHTKRVAVLATNLARAMGFPESELFYIRRGALLHDIGKILIPYHILCKKGHLTDHEKSIIRKHPLYAYKLLHPFKHLRPVLNIPYYHHEKWDGTGYPFGLKGIQIPLAARLFSIVDVWDALCSDRAYRKAWLPGDVKIYIQNQTGRYFDPEIVSIFLKMIETFYPFSLQSESINSIEKK